SRSFGSCVSARKIRWSPALRRSSMTSRIRGMAASQRGEARFPNLQNPLRTSTTIVTFGTLGHQLEARVRPVAPPRLGAGPALDHYDVRRVVINPLEKGAADTVGIDRYPLGLEALDLVDVETTAGDDLDVLESLAVERATNQVAELGVDPTRVEVAHQFLDADIDHRLRGVEPNTPEPILEPARDLERGAHAIVLPVDENHQVGRRVHVLGVFLRRQDAVP